MPPIPVVAREMHLPNGRKSMPIVTELPARFAAACRIEVGKNGQQRKMSWLAPHAFASIVLRLPRSSATTGETS
jgi:hypothetical protein